MSKDLPTDLNALSVRVIQAILPLESDLIGRATVERVVRGSDFADVSGGRHINLVDAFTIVGGLASVLQCVLAGIELHASRQAPPSNPDLLQALLPAVTSLAATNEKVRVLLERRPDVLSEILVHLESDISPS